MAVIGTVLDVDLMQNPCPFRTEKPLCEHTLKVPIHINVDEQNWNLTASNSIEPTDGRLSSSVMKLAVFEAFVW